MVLMVLRGKRIAVKVVAAKEVGMVDIMLVRVNWTWILSNLGFTVLMACRWNGIGLEGN